MSKAVGAGVWGDSRAFVGGDGPDKLVGAGVGVKECDGHTASCFGILVLCEVSRRTETNRSRERLGSENRGLCVISSETGIWACPGCPGLHAEKGCTAEASAWCFSLSRLVELDRLCAAPQGILLES